VLFADEVSCSLDSISRVKSRLADLIEPDFGLLDRLLVSKVLIRRQLDDVRSERTVFRRNEALLELLTSEDQCDKFLTALQETNQQHVVNFIIRNRGQSQDSNFRGRRGFDGYFS